MAEPDETPITMKGASRLQPWLLWRTGEAEKGLTTQ